MLISRKTIVFLTSDYLDYAKVAADVVGSVAAAAGYGTLCVTGRELLAESEFLSEHAVCNGIYRLMERVDVAGLVCESGMLGHRAGPDAVIRFLSRFELPCVSLGLDVPDRPSVISDDVLSMQRLMEHLLGNSNRQRFAFVRGIPNDVYSLERENVFRSILSQHSREVNEALIVTGNYNVFETYEAIEQLLRTHERIDAIVCANDMMALGAARAATAAGLTIPRDLVVTGFDDVPDATRHSPALTTVRQPLVEMAEISVAKLLALIEDTALDNCHLTPSEDRLTSVSSELIVRGSTVTSLQGVSNKDYANASDLRSLLESGMTGLKLPVDADLLRLAEELDHTIKHGSPNLANHLKLVVGKVSREDAHWWSNLCHQIEEVSRHLISSDEQHVRLPYIEAALVCVRERVWALEMEREFAARRHEQMRSGMQLRIGSSAGMDEFLKVIDSWINASRPKRYFLVCYDEPSSEPRTTGNLVRAYCNNVIAPATQETFATRRILPDEFINELEHGTMVMHPVYAGSDHYGYLMIDPDGTDLSQIDSAAHCIGNALRSHYLINALENQAVQLQAANDELSTLANFDALTGLPNRHCFERRLRNLCESRSNDEPFALCFLDLDGFKMVNDVYGHEVGDELLKCVSMRLKKVVEQNVGKQGFVARLGGDEFTAIVCSSNLDEDLRQLGTALVAALSADCWLAETALQISASVGAAIFPCHGLDSATLLKCADAAMYQAKSLGKNRFERYSNATDYLLSSDAAVDVLKSGQQRSSRLRQ